MSSASHAALHPPGRGVRLRSGNQMMAEGALQAGCTFFAGYPITPATGIFKTMVDQLPGRGGVALSAPDEISAVAYCIGAAMRGAKAMTATSGPGWALMTESVQYALMTETPLVVAIVQRLGPSTGGATQGAQGDVLFAEYFTSGGYTVPVLCPTNARQCYEFTILAFTWSELLRMPVVLLSDKEVGMTTESVDDATLPAITSRDRPTNFSFRGSGEYQKDKRSGTYFFDMKQEIPIFAPVGGPRKVTATGSAHDTSGRLQKNSPETIDVLMHLEEKVAWRKGDLAMADLDAEDGAKTLLISYGITARAARQAVNEARHQGERVALLTIYSLFPLPVKHLHRALEGIERVVIAEENLTGLYRSVLQPHCGSRKVIGVNKVGSMITPREILSIIPG